MATPVEQIKERLSIEDVISSYLSLERSGSNFRARCPFHNEKTPSFFVSPGRGSYYCFGCGAKGDMFSFIEQYEGLDFKGALKTLAERAGVTLTYTDNTSKDEKDLLFKVLEEATVYFERQYENSNEAKKYIEGRGVNEKTSREFRIGFAPNEWRALATYLEAKGYKKEVLLKAGLIKEVDQSTGNKKEGYYDRFRGRIMFPITDSSGRVIAFSGRLLVDDQISAKYLNSPETVLFDKSSTLYGLDKAKESIRKKDYSILVEGQLDLILSHQVGITNTVASSGTALSDSSENSGGITNMGMLSRLSKNVVLAFDGDNAGQKAILRGAKIALSLGMDVKVVTLPQERDPADVIKENKDSWIEILKNTKPIVTYTTERIVEKNKDGRLLGKNIRDYVLPLISSMKSSIDQAHSIKIVSDITNISEQALMQDLKNIPKDEGRREIIRDERKQTGYGAGERLYGILFWQEGQKDKEINTEHLEKRIAEIIGTDNALVLKDASIEKRDELIFEAENAYEGRSNIAKDTELLLMHLEENFLRTEMQRITKNIKNSERLKDDNTLSLMEAYKKLGERLEELVKKRNV